MELDGRRYVSTDFCTHTMIQTHCALLSCVGSDIATYLPPSVFQKHLASSSLLSFVLGSPTTREVEEKSVYAGVVAGTPMS